ncbi:hypothetical protein WJX73_003134 [Symbiochloris irregularis]|uniref:UBX domain-containing protein n=1 Tax=Symbiochloris irregularis TaxID=706552 RepID=A0AAW1NQJ1_9CHLO
MDPGSTSSRDQDALGASVARVVQLTNAPVDQARFWLEAANNDVNRAVLLYHEQTGASHRPQVQPHLPTVPTTRPPQPSSRRAHRGGAGRRGGLFGLFYQVPLALARTGIKLVLSTAGLGANLAASILPHSLLQALEGAVRRLADSNRDLSPHEAAQIFARGFAQAYGNVHPTWECSSWHAAASRAHQRFMFLFVYLHSPSHSDTAEFCQNTLCHPDVVAYIDHAVLAWGGSIRHSDAFRLANQLGVSCYPCCALLAFSGSRLRLIASMPGPRSPEQLLAGLRRAVDRHSTQMASEQADHNERNYTRRLRDEQDAAYQESLLADQARERERENARLAAEAEAKAAAEAEHRAREEQEAKRLAAEQAEAARLASKARKRGMLPPEPAAGTAGAAQIRVRMRDGSTHQRRFPAEIALQTVVDWVGSMEEGPTGKFSLASTYPRRVFRGEALQESLTQLSLAPQAALIIHAEDD